MERVCLIVLDGWGMNPDTDGNAISIASTPNLSRLAREYPFTSIDTSGLSVGLPEGQMGNSEVGHLTMGAGRIIYQELTRITKAVNDGSFARNEVFNGLTAKVREKGGALHIMGLVSDGGVHSHIEHLYGILDALKGKGLRGVYIHAFLDGRDTPPKSGIEYIRALVERLKGAGAASIATVSGRYYAMDRDNRWERVKKAYDAMVVGEGMRAASPVAAVEEAYGRGETDEFVLPTVITGPSGPVAPLSDDDGVLFFNFRADRAREITRAITATDFTGFERRKRPSLAAFVCMTEYDAALNLPAVFKPQEIRNMLAEVLSKRGLRQFRVSETEKYAHVTFFFNGGREEPYPGEERLLIPSVKDVPTYDLKPEMRASEIADAAVEGIDSGAFHFMLMNFANGDMVGHTGVLHAAIKACEAVDEAVGRVVDEARKNGWKVIITSDHGNAEQMYGLSGVAPGKNPHTAHTTNRVPFMLIDDARRGIRLKEGGGLQDVAPTALKLMGIEKPVEMDGEALF